MLNVAKITSLEIMEALVHQENILVSILVKKKNTKFYLSLPYNLDNSDLIVN